MDNLKTKDFGKDMSILSWYIDRLIDTWGQKKVRAWLKILVRALE